jgi:hypothetical protein
MSDALNSLNILSQALAGFGLVTALLAVAKHLVERRSWRRYKKKVRDWVGELRETEEYHPKELTDDEWRIVCERLLTDAGYSPVVINEMLEMAVVVARGVAADSFFSSGKATVTSDASNKEQQLAIELNHRLQRELITKRTRCAIAFVIALIAAVSLAMAGQPMLTFLLLLVGLICLLLALDANGSLEEVRGRSTRRLVPNLSVLKRGDSTASSAPQSPAT